jgi:hypothetical protein
MYALASLDDGLHGPKRLVNWKIKTLAFVMATSLFFHVDSQTDKTA